jgi:hypothetical protein
MGGIATVLWAGLLTGELPRTGRWILAFTFSGAIGGFAHYYGNLLYASLLLVLVLAWLARPPRRPLYVLLAWASLSFVPVVTWYLVTRRWSPGTAVASPPNVAELKRWTQYSFAPLTNLLSDQAPASVDGSSGIGAWIAIAVVLVLLVALLAVAARRRRPTDLPTSPSVVLGSAAVAVTALGIVAAWGVSLMLPPSMNTRNLAALVPALFLATGCATAVARRESVRWATAVLVLAVWSGSAAVFTAQHGVTALSPPWQQSAGYAATAKVLVQSQQAPEPPRLVGLQQPWAWHGDWDAVVRAEIGSGPALATGPGPLPVVWVMDDQDPLLTTVPHGPLIVFGYADDPRDAALIAWARRVDGPCDESRLGTSGFGNIMVATCGGQG